MADVGSSFASICPCTNDLFIFSKQVTSATLKNIRNSKVFISEYYLISDLNWSNSRLNFTKGMSTVIKNPNAWLIAAVLGIPNAIQGGWIAMMGDFLPKLCLNGECLTQEWVNILNIVLNVVSAVVAILVAR